MKLKLVPVVRSNYALYMGQFGGIISVQILLPIMLRAIGILKNTRKSVSSNSRANQVLTIEGILVTEIFCPMCHQRMISFTGDVLWCECQDRTVFIVGSSKWFSNSIPKHMDRAFSSSQELARFLRLKALW